MNKIFFIFLIILFLPSVKAIPELPNQFYGSVIYLNEYISNGHELAAQLGTEKFTIDIIDGKYGIEKPLLVSKDSSININKIDFYVDNKKILTQDYNSGGFTELNLNVPSDTVIINETTIEDLNLTIGDSNNLSEGFSGIQKIEFKENDEPLIQFDYDFDTNTVNDLLKNIVIKKQEEAATKGAILIKGIELPLGKTKTVYMDNLNANVNSVCIKDAEISSIIEISSTCNGENEKLLTCDGSTVNGYSCTDLGDKYKITGLIHSGVQEHIPVCGDNICNGGETCSTCSGDCGTCPASIPSGSSNGGGGGGGGGGATPTTACVEDWECKSWSICKPDNTKVCFSWVDRNNCKTILNKPADVTDCVYEGKIEEKKEEIAGEELKKGISSITGAVIGFVKEKSIYLGIGAIVLVVIVGIWQGGNYIRKKRDIYF